MKIAIISDSHDNIPNIEKALKWINKEDIKTIIHCGDIFNKDSVIFIAENFDGQCCFLISTEDAYYLHDIDDLKKNNNLHFYDNYGQIKIAGSHIGFTHYPEYIYQLAKEKLDYILYGHTHFPAEKIFDTTKIINPGNLAGIFCKATFAVLDTEKNVLELKILERLN
ncbi:MAG: hypothetical protein ACD_58C00017G0004 [uncultured bacterium]|nr:MAG: hypothetical protein ACD_58C00017G0004 [uncultured bacterium]